jgi:hypothetical protein
MNGGERSARLRRLGAHGAEVDELLAYTAPRFARAGLPQPLSLPLADEPCVSTWRGYVEEARQVGAWPALTRHLPRLRFPVRRGMSAEADYRAATLRGIDTAGMDNARGLELDAPEQLDLTLEATAAGRIAVITAGCRADFVRLVQALTARNEPVAVPDSMGATMVSGFNNWERVAAWRASWSAAHPGHDAAAWRAEFARLKSAPALYQDRFILLQPGAYSDVSATALGLDEADWLASSLTLRRQHECAHYFTLRVFGAMHNLLADELLADCAGITAVAGRFRGDWFRCFLGLEAAGDYRGGGRLENYRGTPPLSDGAFTVLQQLARAAAQAVDEFVARHPESAREPAARARLLLTLALMPLDAYADAGAAGQLDETWHELQIAWDDGAWTQAIGIQGN